MHFSAPPSSNAYIHSRMAFSPSFTCKTTPNASQFGLTSLTYLPSPTCRRRRSLDIPRDNGVKPEPMFVTTNVSKHIIHQRKPKLCITLAADSDSIHESEFLSDVVQRFYVCINQDDRKGLEDLISKDCYLEDLAFPKLFKGKKEVMGMLIQLVESKGKNIKFKLGTVCKGDDLITASVDWHLEWNESQIPFSRGCSIFKFSNEGEKVVIRKIQNITESPVKPGTLAMVLLKMVRSVFDGFPMATKWFFNSPHIINRTLLSIYGLFLAPIVNPMLAFYFTIWRIMARTLGYVMSFLHIIGRIFKNSSSSTNLDKPSSNDINKASTELDRPSTDNDEASIDDFDKASTYTDNDTSKIETEEGPSSLPEQT